MLNKTLRTMRDAAYVRHDTLVKATNGGGKEHQEHRNFVDAFYRPLFFVASLLAFDRK